MHWQKWFEWALFYSFGEGCYSVIFSFHWADVSGWVRWEFKKTSQKLTTFEIWSIKNVIIFFNFIVFFKWSDKGVCLTYLDTKVQMHLNDYKEFDELLLI